MISKLAAIAVVAGVAIPSAYADAFVQEKGAGRVIVTAVLTNSPRGFDGNGNVADIDNYNQDQVYVNAEYGLTDDLTLIVAPSYRHIAVENAENTTGLGYTEVGARYRLAKGSNWIVSAQGLVRVRGQGRSQRVAQLGNNSTDFDARLAGAYSGATTFVSAEAGYRLRSGDLPNEFHADLNAGAHLGEKFMVLASSTNTFSDGRGQGVFNQKYKYGDVYLSAVYDLNDHFSVQAGYTATIYGKNALRQRGPLFGIWYKF
ncbi:MAG: hypothetical protein IT550_07990 [Novosphingobium sp.]|jgi:hypothetical protein|nr:hypothetical protein [Novosphingobium sp.]